MLPFGAWAWALSSRRDFVTQIVNAGTIGTAVLVSSPLPGRAGSLLEEYGTDPAKGSLVTSASAADQKEQQQHQSDIEPNLRSNYYYPTNKLRYLPRIQKCSQAIPKAFDSLKRQDWNSLEEFATGVADDIVLPLTLYTSSLTGGGTNVKVSYVKDMNKSAAKYKHFQKMLVDSVKKHDVETTTVAMEGLSEALTTYRTIGHLEDDETSPGSSVDEFRSGMSRGAHFV